MRTLFVAVGCLSMLAGARTFAAEPLPYEYRIDVFRQKETDVMVFSLRLEQPFLAGEFEKSNFVRLKALDENAYLIYPKETQFTQKHAEFYGRLRGSGRAKLQLSYELVTEDVDGSRRVDVKQAELEIPIPEKPTGPERIYRAWAEKQNEHFAKLLRYYPEESFFEYVLLQSRERYGVTPPPLPERPANGRPVEDSLYFLFSGGLGIQQALQRETLSGRPATDRPTIHISQLTPPTIRSLPYKDLLKKKAEDGIQPQPHELARFVPEDQYFLHCASVATARELLDLSRDWGESLLRLFTVNARDHHLRQKYEMQLGLRLDGLEQLFADGVVSELAVTGSDFFVAEGTDLTVLLKLKRPEVFRAAADRWLTETRRHFPQMVEREFHYRGQLVQARYTKDRMVSSFVVYRDDYAIFSNSHVAIRRVLDTALGDMPSLYEALDYRYMTTVLPPQPGERTAYLYGSEAFLRRLVSPAFKIAEKRRLQAFNNLVMVNNASLFYRLENGRSPDSITALFEGKYLNPEKLVSSEGGAYGFHAEQDTATNSLYNRLKYLTPIIELDVLRVTPQERAEYERYRRRYEAFWRGMFDPIAVRATVGPEVQLQVAVLPLANSSLYRDLRGWLAKDPQSIPMGRTARSAVLSMVAVTGRKRVGQLLRSLPGVPAVLQSDPTLTDLKWVGERLSVHFCDGETVLEIDPTRFRSQVAGFFSVPISQQLLISSGVAALDLPVYVTIDVTDEDKAARLLEKLSSRIFLEATPLAGVPTELDAYRLPDYRDHRRYVVAWQLYALKVRLHIALVDGQIVAATEPGVLEQVIDAAAGQPGGEPPRAHALLRLNFDAIQKLRDDVSLYWEEKARQACHRNIMPIYNLVKLYGVSVEEVNKLADAKYGVTFFCPGGGEYRYDESRDQVYSTVYGNRQDARQTLALDENSPFGRFLSTLQEVTAALEFTDDGLIATVTIIRRQAK